MLRQKDMGDTLMFYTTPYPSCRVFHVKLVSDLTVCTYAAYLAIIGSGELLKVVASLHLVPEYFQGPNLVALIGTKSAPQARKLIGENST